MQKYTVKDFEQQFPDDAACLEWLRVYLYPDGIRCPKCRKVTKHHRVVSRRSYSCDRCGHHVHPTAGTIYHKSPTSLRLWFYAIYRMASTRCGISAKQLQRELGVTYKTAWRMAKQIRTMMNEGLRPLAGLVEIDDAYIGGKRRGVTGRGAKGKTVVLGLVQRQGDANARVIPNMQGQTVLPIIKAAVPSKETTLFTDEYRTYERLSQQGYRYPHETVRHGDKAYVRPYAWGLAHTNTIEGFWSQVKRSLHGTYHAVSPKYLQSYLNEFSFRYSHRHDADPMFFSILVRARSSGSPA